jgi:lysophospholipase L1-like esterase
MCVGDSITAGEVYPGDFPGAYRPFLYRTLRSAGQSFSFVGSIESGAPYCPMPQNEGVGGNTVANVAARINAAMAANPPDGIIMNIGHNDAQAGTAGINAAYQALCEQMNTNRPGVQLVLGTCLFTVTGAWNTYLIALNAALYSTIVPNLTAQGIRAVISPTRENVPSVELVDGIHPTRAGYEGMARAWASTILGTPC